MRSGRLFLLAAPLLPCACAPPAPQSPPPRNLLLVTLDTLRADHLGAYGYGRPTSPALDAFAAEAVRFADVTCSMPTTLPSHVTLFTGLPPSIHGVTDNGVVPAAALESIFERLEAAGLASGAVTGAGLLRAKFLAPLGLPAATVGHGNRDRVPPEVRGEEVTDAALAWLDDHRGRRFALWVHYYDPHEPYDPPPAEAARFAAPGTSLPAALSTPWLLALNRDAAGLSARERQHVVDLYDAEVALLDRAVGRLLAGLRARGLWEETVLVVVSDHGQAHGESGSWGHGLRFVEPVIRVALLIRLPGAAAGRVVTAPVETLDVAPTLLELFRLDPDPDLPGRSLAPALRGEPLAGTERRVIELRTFAETPMQRGIAVVGADWKAIYYREADGGERRLLGRREAPGGLDGENLWSAAAPEASILKEAIARSAAARTPPAAIDPEERALLESLGYVN